MDQIMEKIREIEKRLFAYNYALALIGIDDATAAPTESAEGRSEAVGLLSMEQYRLLVGPELGALLDQAAGLNLDRQAAAEVRELRRMRAQYTKIPPEEFAADSRVFTLSQNAWQKAKAASDFSLFAPWLEKVIEIRRRWAGYFAPEKDVYDVWLDYYQAGLSMAQADPFFASLRQQIVPLLAEIQEKGRPIRTDFLTQDWPLDAQAQLSHFVMEVMGLTREHCVLAESEHPFTSSLYDGDVRITTHYLPDNMVSNLYSVVHEGGHALYERNIRPALRYTVLGEGSCPGVHESQSRLFENYIGRSREFLSYLWPELNRLFPAQLAGVSCEEFYQAVNLVTPSLIRTDADELTYPLHIMIRYELEKQLLHGELSVQDLPAAWNRMYKEYLGIDVPDDARGVLQDIHWSGGDLGYFPSYALGTAYAAQMVEAMKKELDFEGCCASGNLEPIQEYLARQVWQYGKELQPDELIRSGCGGEFDPSCFARYLETKYRELYAL